MNDFINNKNKEKKLITETNLQNFFNESLTSALHHQHIETKQDTIVYIINLLTYFSQSENLFEETSDGLTLKPLAEHYAEALNSSSIRERNVALQRLGDVSLFISGLFASSLSRKTIDIDYYIAMGGNAYSYLHASSENSVKGRTFAPVFHELSEKFVAFVDALAEINELSSNQDTLRTYEVWLRTGSKRCEKILHKNGIFPSKAFTSHKHH